MIEERASGQVAADLWFLLIKHLMPVFMFQIILFFDTISIRHIYMEWLEVLCLCLMLKCNNSFFTFTRKKSVQKC